jgi:hypothetical protein
MLKAFLEVSYVIVWIGLGHRRTNIIIDTRIEVEVDTGLIPGRHIRTNGGVVIAVTEIANAKVDIGIHQLDQFERRRRARSTDTNWPDISNTDEDTPT